MIYSPRLVVALVALLQNKGVYSVLAGFTGSLA